MILFWYADLSGNKLDFAVLRIFAKISTTEILLQLEWNFDQTRMKTSPSEWHFTLLGVFLHCTWSEFHSHQKWSAGALFWKWNSFFCYWEYVCANVLGFWNRDAKNCLTFNWYSWLNIPFFIIFTDRPINNSLSTVCRYLLIDLLFWSQHFSISWLYFICFLLWVPLFTSMKCWAFSTVLWNL